MARETIEGLSGDLMDVVVARGRTVTSGNGFKLQEITSVVDSRQVAATVREPIPGKFEFFEGETVSLSRDDANRLLELGFVHRLGENVAESRPAGINNARGPVDPNAPEVISANKL